MLKGFQNVFKVKELTGKLWITFLLLIVFRFGRHVPLPGVNAGIIYNFMSSQTKNTLLALYDMFTGGAFFRVTLFSLGIMPYITASIILQMLVYVIPELKKLQEDGERGQKVITQYTRYLTVAICILQGFAYALWIKNLNIAGGGVITINPTLFTFLAVITFTTGTIFLMWLGETITESGIGNGISLIILVGIIARLIPALLQMIATGGVGVWKSVILLAILFIVTVGSVLLTLGARRIPIMYPKKVQGRKIVQGGRNYLPLRVNAANVIPIIFAQSLMMFPSSFTLVIKSQGFRNFINTYLGWNTWAYNILYFVLIILFTFFYTAIIFNPEEVATNLKKYGGFIQGKRPGKKTANYLQDVLNRVTFVGAFMLAIIAITPKIIIAVFKIPPSLGFLFGGTSLLIVVGVVLDTIQQIEGHLLMRHYEGFSKRRIRSRHM